MVWKCPKCSHKSQSHTAMMKHYYKAHPTAKKSAAQSKGKAKKIFVFKPLRRHK